MNLRLALFVALGMLCAPQLTTACVIFLDSTAAVPASPDTASSIVLEAHGDLSDTTCELSEPQVSWDGNSVEITIYDETGGIGVPVLLPLDVEIPIGSLPEGDYDYVFQFVETFQGMPLGLMASDGGSFSVTASVPALDPVGLIALAAALICASLLILELRQRSAAS